MTAQKIPLPHVAALSPKSNPITFFIAVVLCCFGFCSITTAFYSSIYQNLRTPEGQPSHPISIHSTALRTGFASSFAEAATADRSLRS